MGRALDPQQGLFDDEDPRAQLEAIRDWAATTTDGSRQDLPFRPLPAVWESVQAEQGNCLGRACDHYQHCHYQQSRRRAHGVRLLVVNHSLLMAHLALRRRGAGFLPELDAIILDEAHDLEDIAAEHLGLRVSARGIAYQLGRLWSPRRQSGLLKSDSSRRLRGLVDGARQAARAFFEEAAGLLGASAESRTSIVPDGAHLPDTLSPRLAELATRLMGAAADSKDLQYKMELGARARGIRALADSLSALARDELEDQVRWGELSNRGALALHSAPIDVGPLLEEVLFDTHDAVILTSATLATGHPPNFDFIRSRLGLRDAETISIGSPFDYPRQARLVLRADLPDPVRDPAGFEAALPDAVLAAVRRTRGGTFVLFTSKRAMGRTAVAVRDALESDGLRVLVQGESLERPALIDAFRQGDAVLFGLSSFWQGVDVQGDALRHVVIARLPFEVPTHPLQVARSRRLQERGGDPFRQLSLPTAALRLKQGFGRLIRHSDDEGVVTLLDPRAATRAYGRYLLGGLPDCPRELVQ